jgi:hypothetical protein
MATLIGFMSCCNKKKNYFVLNMHGTVAFMSLGAKYQIISIFEFHDEEDSL